MTHDNIVQFSNHIIENELTIRQIREVKAVISKEKTIQNVNTFYDTINSKNAKTLKVTKKTSLALKIALARLDIIIEETQSIFGPEQGSDVISFLMDLRLKIHSLIDDTIRFKNLKISKSSRIS